jgi:hypothetical protein
MVYAYRLRDRSSKEIGRVVEGFTVKHTWQFTSDAKAASLKKWKTVSILESNTLDSLKKEIDAYDKEQKKSEKESQNLPGHSEDPLVIELEEKSPAELKEYAASHGFDEAEYSKLTKSKLIEYIVLGMREKENA